LRPTRCPRPSRAIRADTDKVASEIDQVENGFERVSSQLARFRSTTADFVTASPPRLPLPAARAYRARAWTRSTSSSPHHRGIGKLDLRLIVGPQGGRSFLTRGDGAIAADLSDRREPARSGGRAMGALGGRIDVARQQRRHFRSGADRTGGRRLVEGWERTMRVNLTASAELCRLARAPLPQAWWGGRIVNVASRAAYRGDSPQHWHYAASKAGMIGMTKSIARGYAGEGILAFAVCPGFTMTGMAEDYLESRGGSKLLADIPLGRVASAEEVAETVRWLAVDAPPSATGAVIDVNGASFVR
jgi:NAD(P)-dependent dehydrogenase (short-subunit alcohol dehydrogenase family)